MNTKNLLFLSLLLLGSLFISSCSNEEDGIENYKTKQLQPKNSYSRI